MPASSLPGGRWWQVAAARSLPTVECIVLRRLLFLLVGVLAVAVAVAAPATAAEGDLPGDPDSPFTDARPFPWTESLLPPGVSAQASPPALRAARIRPAREGSYRVRRHQVDAGRAVRVTAPAKAEFRSEVELPLGAPDRRPLVVFLHGMHASCFQPGQGDYGWPCRRNWRPVPSFQGYRYVADRLASQGFATVSISANGVNGQDEFYRDGGTRMRARLVRTHLQQLRRAQQGRRSYYPRRLARRIDLSRVILVGHSRGATGVTTAALELADRQPSWLTVRAVVSLAGTNTLRSSVPGVPLLTLLPQCDGDVFTLESQQLVDTGARISGDRALRSAIWLPGANHNFLNTQWTPGISAAPSVNDAVPYNKSQGDCALGRRLSAGQERRAARSYLAATARLFGYGDTTMAQFVDGSPTRPGDVGTTGTRSAAAHGSARLLERQWRGHLTSRGLTAAAGTALHQAVAAGWNDAWTPHWQPDVVFGGRPARQRALQVQWAGSGRVLSRLRHTRDLTGTSRLQARIAVDVAYWSGNPRIALVLQDRAGRTAQAVVPAAQLVRLSSADFERKLWGQSASVRIRDLRADEPRLDLRHVTHVGVAALRGRARLWVLDVWARPALMGWPRPGDARGIRIDAVARPSGNRFRIDVTAAAGRPVRADTPVLVAVYPYEGGFEAPTERTIVIPAGRTSASEHVRLSTADVTVAALPLRRGLNVTSYWASRVDSAG